MEPKRIARIDGSEPTLIGRDDDAIQMGQVLRSVKQQGGQPVNPQMQVASLMQMQGQNIGDKDGLITDDGSQQISNFKEEIAMSVLPEQNDKIDSIIARAKQRLTNIKQAQASDAEKGPIEVSEKWKQTSGKDMRYPVDADPGKDEELRTKDNYPDPYAEKGEYIKTLKSNLTLKLMRLSTLLKSDLPQDVSVGLENLRGKVAELILKAQDVAEEVRMKKETYKPETDVGRKADESRMKGDETGIKSNTLNDQLTKMWSDKGGTMKVAQPPMPMGKEPKIGLPDEKMMGGNDMKKLPADKGAPEKMKEPIPKGKIPEEDSKKQLNEIQKAIDELKKNDEEFEEDIMKLEKAIEGLGGKVKSEKPKEKEEKRESKPKMDMEEVRGGEKEPKTEKKEKGEDKGKEKEKPQEEKKKAGLLGLRKGRNRGEGLTAIFTREPTKLASYWKVLDSQGNEMLRADCKSIYGKNTFENWDWVASKEYGTQLLARIRSEGVRKIASVLGVEPSMTREARMLEINAQEKSRTPALTKKIDIKEYYQKAYGDKDYGSKLTKQYAPTRKASSDVNIPSKKAGDDSEIKVADLSILNKELVKENELLRLKLSAQEQEMENKEKKLEEVKNEKSEQDEDMALQMKAKESMAIADKMVEAKMIQAEQKDDIIDKLMLMDDVSLAMNKGLVADRIATASASTLTMKRIGGLKSIPSTVASPDLGIPGKVDASQLSNIWSMPKVPASP